MRLALPLLLSVSWTLLGCGAAAPQGPEPALPTSGAPSAALPPVPPPTSAPPSTNAAMPPPTAATDTRSPAPTGLPTQAGSIRFRGGDGSSEAQAIVIEGARGEQDGVASEYAWLDQVYGSRLRGAYRVLQQALRSSGGKHFDVLTVESKGTTRDVWFDITAYFGKF